MFDAPSASTTTDDEADKAQLLALLRDDHFKTINEVLVRLYNGKAEFPLPVDALHDDLEGLIGPRGPGLLAVVKGIAGPHGVLHRGAVVLRDALRRISAPRDALIAFDAKWQLFYSLVVPSAEIILLPVTLAVQHAQELQAGRSRAVAIPPLHLRETALLAFRDTVLGNGQGALPDWLTAPTAVWTATTLQALLLLQALRPSDAPARAIQQLLAARIPFLDPHGAPSFPAAPRFPAAIASPQPARASAAATAASVAVGVAGSRPPSATLLSSGTVSPVSPSSKSPTSPVAPRASNATTTTAVSVSSAATSTSTTSSASAATDDTASPIRRAATVTAKPTPSSPVTATPARAATAAAATPAPVPPSPAPGASAMATQPPKPQALQRHVSLPPSTAAMMRANAAAASPAAAAVSNSGSGTPAVNIAVPSARPQTAAAAVAAKAPAPVTWDI